MRDYYSKSRKKYFKKPEEYWNLMAKKYKSEEAVLVPGDLKQKNNYYDSLHRKVMNKIFAIIPKGSKILDAGCGVGRWSIELAKRGMDVTGVDISREMINLAKENAKRQNQTVKFLVSSLDKMKLPPNSFDFVISVTVLQHIVHDTKRRKAIYNLARALKPKGKMIILEKTRKEKFKEFHVYPLTKEEWISLLSENNLQFLGSHGVDVAPFIDFVSTVGMRFKYRKLIDSELYPGLRSLDETSSNFLKSIYSAILVFVTSLSKPVDYFISDLPYFKNLSKHLVMIFEKK